MDKNAIKKFATWARRELIERIRQQAYRYGVEDANTDLYANAAHGVVLTPTQRSQRQALIERMQAKGYEATIEEVAYTWFDRFCALRFMEVNGYLPGKLRMFSDENGAFRPQILANALNVELEGLNINTVIQLKEENKTEELFKYLLLTMCNVLKPILTLFQPDDRGCHLVDRDYTWLLLPDNLLREGSVPEQMILMIPEDDWKDAVQIVGWLYQYYNAEPKDQVFANLKKNIKISKENIPAATQLFTPDWIVRYMVENSLGRLWVEGHPDNSLKNNWKYYIEETEQESEVQAQLEKIWEEYAAIKPEEILCIDPCMGSGHILVYMFDVLVQIYEAYGYPTREAVASIVQNNLWGLDIDDRAAQLAYFSITMKARQYDKGWFRRGIQPHVMAIQESNCINRDHLRYLGNSMSSIEFNNATTQMEALLDEFIDAKEYGSIIQPQEFDWKVLYRFVSMTDPEGQVTMGEVGIDATQERLLQIIEQGQALAQEYHVIVTNPPYMGSSGMGDKLAKRVKDEYPDSKSDLFAVFIERALKMLKMSGYQSMITQHNWMFLSSFEKLRDKLNDFNLVNLAHLGIGTFEELNSKVVQSVVFTYRNCHIKNYFGTFDRLFEKQGLAESNEEKKKWLLTGKHRYYAITDSFSQIPGSPIAYWAKNSTFAVFRENDAISDLGWASKGIITGDNATFLRLWYEVNVESINFSAKSIQDCLGSDLKWYPCNKGGDFRRWFGNNEYIINWLKNGNEIMQRDIEKIRNCQDYKDEYKFIPSITWTSISTAKASFRYSNMALSESAGMTLFVDEKIILYVLGFLNTKVTEYLLSILNPTLNYTAGAIACLPCKIQVSLKDQIDKVVKSIIAIEKADWDSFETSWDFQNHPLLQFAYFSPQAIYQEQQAGYQVMNTLQQAYENWARTAEDRFIQLKDNEKLLNRIFIDIYGLKNELTPDVDDKEITVRKANLGREIRSLISYAVGCMFGRYSMDKPGLILAGQNFSEKYVYASVHVAGTGLTGSPSLNTVHGDCYLIQGKNDLIRCSYSPDRDGILPITDDEYFGDDIVTMFVDWIKTAYGDETLEENLKFIASALYSNCGGSARDQIRQYFLNDFYKDHLKIYQKRPIYWMFDSGKKNGLKCLVYMHRWDKDTVARVRTDYVHEMQSRYRTAIEELSRRVENASGSERVRLQKQLAKIQEQDAELLKYEEKVHHLADQMIAIDLDDGVKHNYAIFEDVLAPLK